MKWRMVIQLAAALIGIVVVACPHELQAEIVLLGQATFAGDAADLSPSAATLENGTPANRLGGISAIEYTGGDNRYLILSDRSPADGATTYRCRFHAMHLNVQPGSANAVTATLISTTFLRDERGNHLVGAASAFDADDPRRGLRFDPESVRCANGRLYLSDEYGPFIAEFSATGTRSRLLAIPRRFQVLHPATTPEEEGRLNSSGRQTNAGLEGMTVTPDGHSLIAMMQRPLIQDSAPAGKAGKRQGRNNRVMQIDLADGRTHEHVYVLEDERYGVSEVLAVNGHEFLVLERDGMAGEEAECKRIYKVDLKGASDISDYDALPAEQLPESIKPVNKALFVDLLDERYKIRGANCPEKMEGLAFGPDLSDGRRLLILACDSDFDETRLTIFYAFAIDRKDLPRFGWPSGQAGPPARNR